jgi:hypothetical protein
MQIDYVAPTLANATSRATTPRRDAALLRPIAARSQVLEMRGLRGGERCRSMLRHYKERTST